MKTIFATLICLSAFASSALAYDSFDADFLSDAQGAEPYRSSYLLAGLTEIVYDHKNKRKKKWARIGVTEVGYHSAKQHGGQVAVVTTAQHLFVVVRGTKGGKDILQDVRGVADHRWSKGKLKVHAGFGDQAKSLYGWTLKTIKAHQGNRKIWVTGHSLGGAVANLLAYRLVRDAGVRLQGVMTFAAPRVGGDAWAKSYKRRVPNSWRWINGQDPVPHMPNGKNWDAVGVRHVIRKGKHLKFNGAKSPRSDVTKMGARHSSTKYLRALWKGTPSNIRDGLPEPGLLAPD